MDMVLVSINQVFELFYCANKAFTMDFVLSRFFVNAEDLSLFKGDE
jgi:hypothetical protein